jgi:hypothetical protein
MTALKRITVPIVALICLGISCASIAQAPASTEAMRTELRALYTDLEGFIKAGKFTEKGWSLSKEKDAWNDRLSALLKKVRADSSIDQSVIEATEAINRLYNGLSFSDGKFGDLQKENLKIVLEGIRTGPSDSIGAETLKLASAHGAAENPEEDTKAEAEARAALAAHTAEAQKQLRVFYDELQRMRNDATFHQLGFSSKNKYASDWKTRVEAWRNRIDKDNSIAPQVRASAGSLLMLGLEWQRNKGAMTDMAKFHANMIRDALNWKLEE